MKFISRIWLDRDIDIFSAPISVAQIYNFTRNAVDWPLYLYQDDMHFGVTGHAAECSDIRGGMIVSTRVKDAVCDDVRSKVSVESAVVYIGCGWKMLAAQGLLHHLWRLIYDV